MIDDTLAMPDLASTTTDDPPGQDPKTARIRRNLDRLIAQKAPQRDIDYYLEHVEGLQPKAAQAPSPAGSTGNIDLRTQRESTAVTPKATPKTTTSTLGSVISGLAQGSTLGFADEILGGIHAANSLLPKGFLGGEGAPLSALGANYIRDRNKVRDFDAAASREHGTAHGVGSLAGGLLPLLATDGASAMAPGIARTALQGAAYGGTAAAGHAKELSDVPGDAAMGAVVGGVSAPIFSGLLTGAGKLVAPRQGWELAPSLPPGRAQDAVGSFERAFSPAGKAGGQLADRLAVEGNTPGSIIDQIAAQNTKKPIVLGDLSRQARKLTKTTARVPGQGGETIRSTLEDRSAGTAQRLADDLGTGTADARPALEQQVAARSANAARNYGAANESGTVFDDPTTLELLQRPALADAWKRAQRMAKNEGRELPTTQVHTMPKEIDKLLNDAKPGDRDALLQQLTTSGAVATREIPVPDTQAMSYLDKAIRTIKDQKYGAASSSQKADAASIDKAYQALRDHLVSGSPELGTAISDFADQSKPIDALNLGLNAFKYLTRGNQKTPKQAMGQGDPQAMALARRGIDGLESAVGKMSDPERGQFQKGFRTAIQDAMDQTPANLDGSTAPVLRSVFKDTPQSARWQRLLFDDPAEFQAWSKGLGEERNMALTASKVGTGSDTAEEQAAQAKLLGGASPYMLMRHPKIAVASMLLKKAAKPSDATLDELGGMLSTQGSGELTKLLQSISQTQATREGTKKMGGYLSSSLGGMLGGQL